MHKIQHKCIVKIHHKGTVKIPHKSLFEYNINVLLKGKYIVLK